MGDVQPCNVEGISIVLIKIFNRMVRELKEVSCVPQLKINLILVGSLKVLGSKISARDVLKMLSGSMFMMKGVRRNNFYYLKGNIVTGQVTIFIDSDDDCTLLWYMRLGYKGEKSLQVIIK